MHNLATKYRNMRIKELKILNNIMKTENSQAF